MQHIVRGLIACGLLAALAGCEPAPPPPAAGSEAAPPVVPSPPANAVAPPAPVPPPSAATAVLRGLTLGDRGCYVTLEDAQGLSSEGLGRMELCELTALIGQPVIPDYAEEAVAAESCQGDPECSQTETVRLLVALAPAR